MTEGEGTGESERAIADALAPFPPAMVDLVLGARVLIRSQFPAATEEIVLRPGGVTFGYCETSYVQDGVIAIEIAGDSVVLSFPHGRDLSVPTELFSKTRRDVIPLNAERLAASHLLKVVIRNAGAGRRGALVTGPFGRTVIRR